MPKLKRVVKKRQTLGSGLAKRDATSPRRALDAQRHHPYSPSPTLPKTCPGPMSKWRLKGYVQDSDEEDDVESDSSGSSLSSAPSYGESAEHFTPGKDITKLSSSLGDAPVQVDAPTPRISPRQWSPRVVIHVNADAQKSTPPTELSTSPAHCPPSTSVPALNDDLNTPDSSLRSPMVEPPKSQVEASITREELSSVNQNKSALESAQRFIGRSLRPRRLVQEHPYLVDDVRHRMEFEAHGLKPIRVPKTSSQRIVVNDAETQEQEFNPDFSSESDSQETPEVPLLPPTSTKKRLVHSPRRTTDVPIRKTPLVRPGSAVAQRQYGAKRRKLTHPSSPSTTALHRPQHPGSGSASRLQVNTQLATSGDVYDVPSSPPVASSAAGRLKQPVPLNGRKSEDVMTPSGHRLLSKSAKSVLLNQLDLDFSSDSSSSTSERHNGHKSPHIPSHSRSLSPSSTPSSESEAEIQTVKKRIKGVLPASWLRLDQEAQKKREDREAIIRDRKSHHASPAPSAPVRGIAQRIVRPGGARRSQSPRSATKDPIVISDDSDSSADQVINRPEATLPRPTIEADLPGMNGFEDSDSEDMEDDRLHLFTLGEDRPKAKRQKRPSKRQPKITENFVEVSRDSSKTAHKGAGSSTRPRTNNKKRKAGPNPKKTNRIAKAIPKLSIVDSTQITSDNTRTVPQFIRLAIRQARQHPDQGRHSPRRKAIRLKTATDTNDAMAPLAQWRAGSLKRKTGTGGHDRPPLADQTNLQRPQNSTPSQKHGYNEAEILAIMSGDKRAHTASLESLKPNRATHRPTSGPAAMQPPGRTSVSINKNSRRWPVARSSSNYRTAQLEGLESDFNTNNRNAAFEKELSRVDQQFALEMVQNKASGNIQLSKFLADDDAVRMPTYAPSIEAVSVEDIQNRPINKRLRKRPAQRVDADLREYRQPSEPTLHDPLPEVACDLPIVKEDQVLQGLGPYGTRYSTTFDVFPLQIGTFFQSTTFIGSGQLKKCLENGRRNLDVSSGFYCLRFEEESQQCGPWNDAVSSSISSWVSKLCLQMDTQALERDLNDDQLGMRIALSTLSQLLRGLNVYISTSLSFLDPIDRRGFLTKMKHFVETLLSSATNAADVLRGKDTNGRPNRQCIRIFTHLLVLAMQASQISQNPVADDLTRTDWRALAERLSLLTIRHILRDGIPDLQDFLEANMSHRKREDGVQDECIAVESLVTCMHVTHTVTTAQKSFWDIVSNELGPQAETAVHVSTFEAIWVKVFTILPFTEFDSIGILDVGRRFRLDNDNWLFIKGLLNRIFLLYSHTLERQSRSLNTYVKATLRRCHTLIQSWGWKKCDPALGAIFGFFARNGLKPLQCEETQGSPRFLEDLTVSPSLEVDDRDTAFHIFLKCLALGLQVMRTMHTEKKFRSLVWRYIPNHGRVYPKEEELRQEDLDALRNHHDILCTLYWASPPSCRPRVAAIQGLVQHSSSHREACRLNVRTWAILSKFQIASQEPYSSLQPFALWHKEIVQQTLALYRLAKTEAESLFKALQVDDSASISSHMIHQAVRENQLKVIGTLRDSILGMENAIKCSVCPESAKDFLVDSGVMDLLELYEMEDSKLTVVIRDTLRLVKQYAAVETKSEKEETVQQSNEESQDYGDFPDLDDFDTTVLDIPETFPPTDGTQKKSDSGFLDFIRTPLWHLLSNAFGAENPPDDEFLTECVDAWVLIAKREVCSKKRSWEDYIESYSSISWQQLRDTEQARKFGVYFISSIIEQDSKAYMGHQEEFMTAWLLSLVERESTLKFQHRLTNGIMNTHPSHPLVENLPFVRDPSTDRVNITLDMLRTRRLALISSFLANLRDDLRRTKERQPDEADEKERAYAAMLKRFMTRMKQNFQELQQGDSTIVGSYVEFVQKIVQFLSQYTSDICPIDRFFTDSAHFPLPTTDPEYVVGRLVGYASKLTSLASAKELSNFVYRVTQQAALESQQSYLVEQLCSALSGSDTEVSGDRVAIRSILFESVLPAYIDAAFDSTPGFVLSRPILVALGKILPTIHLDLTVTDADSVYSCARGLFAILYAFVKNMEVVINNPSLLQKCHILHGLVLVLEAVAAGLPLLEYIVERTSGSRKKNSFHKFFEEFAIFVAEVISCQQPQHIPAFEGRLDGLGPPGELLKFTTKEFREIIRNNWKDAGLSVFFRQGHTRKEVLVNVDAVEEEKRGLIRAAEHVFAVLWRRDGNSGWETEFTLAPGVPV